MFRAPEDIETFSPGVAVDMSLACSLVYSDQGTVRDVAAAYNFDYRYFEVDDVQASLFSNPDYHVLVFRGSELSLPDWWQNFKLWRKPFLYGLCHAGFVEEWETIRRLVFPEITTDKPFLVSGHSKGAALATLAALDLHTCGIPISGVYTYGSPRVCGPEAAEHYKALLGSRTFRLYHSNDIVTRTPWAIRFRHVGVPVYVHEDAGWTVNPSLRTRIWSQATSYWLDSIEDHGIKGYQRALTRGAAK